MNSNAINDNDPWLCRRNICSDISKEVINLQFEDDFAKHNYQRLDDSEQYLAILEKKLFKLKLLEKKQELIKSAHTAHDSYMVHFSNQEQREYSNLNQDLYLNEPINNNSLSSKLKYQLTPKQPLTVGELTQLLKSDILSEKSES